MSAPNPASLHPTSPRRWIGALLLLLSAVLAPDAGEVPQDWVLERWPELGAIEEHVEAGEMDAARSALDDWVGDDIERLLAGLDATRADELLGRIDAVTRRTRAYRVQLALREVLVPLREADRGSSEHPDVLRAKLNLAVTRSALGDRQGALELEEEVYAVQRLRLPPTAPARLLITRNLAVTRESLGDLNGAIELRAELVEALSRTRPPEDAALQDAQHALGLVHYRAGNYSEAFDAFHAIHEAREKALGAEAPALLEAKLLLAAVCNALGDHAAARRLQERVVEVRRPLGPEARGADTLLIHALNNLAATCQAEGDYSAGRELLEELLLVQTEQTAPEPATLLTTKQNLGGVLLQLGELERARELLESVLLARERRSAPEDPDLLAARLNVGALRYRLGDKKGARELFEVVHAVRERTLPEDHPELLLIRANLAATRAELGDLAGAAELQEKVLEAREGQYPTDHPTVLDARQNLAVTLRTLGEAERARELLDAVHTVRSRTLPAGHPDRLAAQENLALAESDTGRVARAYERLVDACARREEYGIAADPALLDARRNLAALAYRVGDLERLERTCAAILSEQRAVVSRLATEAPRVARSAALDELQRLAPLLAYRGVLVAAGRRDLAPELVSVVEGLRSVSVSVADLARARRGSSELARALDELSAVRAELSERSSAGPDREDLETWRAELIALAEQRDRLERTVRSALGRTGTSSTPEVSDLAGALSRDSALVCYLRYDRYALDAPAQRDRQREASLLAFVVSPDAAVKIVELGPCAPLLDQARAWRAALGRPVAARAPGVGVSVGVGTRPKADLRELGVALRARALDPVLAAAPDARRLVVVPDDLLFLVPLDALPLEEGTVGDRIPLRTVTTVDALVGTRAAEEPDAHLVAVGGIDYDARRGDEEHEGPRGATPGPGFAPLPAAEAEVLRIGELFARTFERPPTVITGADATRERVLAEARRASVLHVATHGWFAPEPRAGWSSEAGSDDRALSSSVADTIRDFLPETLCGLALAGANLGEDDTGRVVGILTAEELATVDLTRCDLAVLSACESNVGLSHAGQGIQSLQTALHAAGARTAITSLWKVDDAATQRLFTLFYRAHWEEGLGKAAALRKAQATLRDAGAPERDWAAWVLSGSAD